MLFSTATSRPPWEKRVYVIKSFVLFRHLLRAPKTTLQGGRAFPPAPVCCGFTLRCRLVGMLGMTPTRLIAILMLYRWHLENNTQVHVITKHVPLRPRGHFENDTRGTSS